MRVFLDTNIWVSALAAPGLCEALLKALFESHAVLSSELVWAELAEVLVRKLHFTDEELNRTRALFEDIVLVPDVAEPADNNDARLVAAASAAGAELFVTGDRRVLGWDASGKMRIVTPRAAWIMLFAPHLQH